MTPTNEQAAAANSPLARDTVLQNRYQIVRQLGRGGMGAVYEAVDQRLGITVALKETLSAEASLRKQFEHEARLLAGMQHPALPRVSDHFVEGPRAFLVMQFIGGVDLARIISQQPGPFPRDQVIAWADQLLDALIYLHSRDRQVIHRDIKPHNLKLTSTGQIALLDFGLAKAQQADTSVTASRAFFGYTKHYAPLEQIQDQRTDPRSDIYALGATLYHLLTGIKPPDALVRASALVNSEPDPLKPANQVIEAVGPHISAILNKAMAQKSEDRYASADEFREALRRVGRAINKHTRTLSQPGNQSEVSVVTPNSGDLKMAMVVSTRRFGPGAVTALLVVLMTLAVGILYGSPKWLQSIGKVAAATPANTVAGTVASTVQRQATQPQSPRKAERQRPVSTLNVVAAKARNSNEDEPAERVNPMKPTPVTKPQPKMEPGREKAKDSRGGRARVAAPSIRLPYLEVGSDVSTLSPDSKIRGYGSSPDAPQFSRTADGTFIIKFSDGTTRVVRPGERTAQ